eukprot:gene9049-biopygen10704
MNIQYLGEGSSGLTERCSIRNIVSIPQATRGTTPYCSLYVHGGRGPEKVVVSMSVPPDPTKHIFHRPLVWHFLLFPRGYIHSPACCAFAAMAESAEAAAPEEDPRQPGSAAEDDAAQPASAERQ